ncbi:MAG: nitroreductase family protein [Oligoflexia bacterium]|nr:nitroreductase family protein [Oligoflexia bacterium]
MKSSDLITERRSITFFDPNAELSSSKIKELIDLANLAPSSMNLQPWEVIVIKDKEKKAGLKECAFNQAKVQEASAVFIIIADNHAVEENLERCLDDWVKLGYLKNQEKENYRQMAFNLYGKPNSEARKIFAIKNASFFAMNLMVAAKTMGIETHPLDGFDQAMIKKEFKIDEDKFIPLLIAIGQPIKDLKLLPRAYRRDFAEYVSILG